MDKLYFIKIIKDLPFAGFYDGELIEHLGDGLRAQLVLPADLEHTREFGILIGSR